MIYTMFTIPKLDILIKIYIVVYYLVLSISVGYVMIKKLWENFSYIRFVLLLLMGLIFNIVYGILPNEHFILNEYSQNILSMTILVFSLLCILNYMKQEYKMKPFLKIYQIGTAIYLMFILLFIIPYLQTESLGMALKFFFNIPIILLLIQFFYSVVTVMKEIVIEKNSFMKMHLLSGIGAIIIIVFLLMAFCFTENKNIILTIFNVLIILFCIDFLMYKKRFSDVKTSAETSVYILDILTNREQEILTIIIERPEITYSEISEKLFISEKTLSAHLSKIYKKLEVKGKPELIEKFSIKNNKS